MSARYNESFKRQAVEKALSRSEGATLAEISDLLGIGYSTLQKWIVKFGSQPVTIPRQSRGPSFCEPLKAAMQGR